MGMWSSLNRGQKEALWLLQIGTFLEYFDLMLYIHMAVLLNDLFFPPTDPYSASLQAAFAFCSTYIMRPIGAWVFGRLGDRVGRKATIVATTVLMSISCIIMANLPTYAQIGIASAWIMTICRMAQGMSSMGEIIGAQIYIAESIPRPASYPAVACIPVSSAIGAMTALGVASLVTSFSFNWRAAFWMGAGIALVGAIARTRLRETPDFLEMKRKQIKEIFADENRRFENEKSEDLSKQTRVPIKKHLKNKTLVSYFLIYCGWPLTFYMAFIYFNPILKENFGYTPADIISHNFFLSIVMLITFVFWTFLSFFIHPIKILKIKGFFIIVFMILMPFLVIILSSPVQLFLLQSFILIFALHALPADAVFIYHLPIQRRFTFASFLYALTRALVYVITSFGLVYLGSSFGPFGLWFITLPMTFAYLYGIFHFEGLERRMGMFAPNNPFYKTDLLKKSWFKA